MITSLTLYYLIIFSCLIIIILALRIHMSDSTTEVLRGIGGFHIEERGQLEVKVGQYVMFTTAHKVISKPKYKRLI